MSTARMLREFLGDPLGTAAIAPSSAALADAMLSGLDFTSIRHIVEFGPGTGVFTRAVIERCREAPLDGRTFTAIERNPRLAADLTEAIEGPPNGKLRIVSGDAVDVEQVTAGSGPIDLVISGLGWPSIPQAPRDTILRATHRVLRSGSQFRTFGYHIGLCLPGAWAFRKTCRELFDSVAISPVVWANVPPAFVYTCTKAH